MVDAYWRARDFGVDAQRATPAIRRIERAPVIVAFARRASLAIGTHPSFPLAPRRSSRSAPSTSSPTRWPLKVCVAHTPSPRLLASRARHRTSSRTVVSGRRLRVPLRSGRKTSPCLVRFPLDANSICLRSATDVPARALETRVFAPIQLATARRGRGRSTTTTL